jgi:acetylornithine deacetylase/succinyl-diaminopimelate desuccinylase-like protein
VAHDIDEVDDDPRGSGVTVGAERRLAALLAEILERLRERPGATNESKQAWTDVARLGMHDIPAVNFGPGLSAQAHQAAEHASVSKLVEGYRLFERFLTR